MEKNVCVCGCLLFALIDTRGNKGGDSVNTDFSGIQGCYFFNNKRAITTMVDGFSMNCSC